MSGPSSAGILLLTLLILNELPIPFGQVDFTILLNGCGGVSTACCINL
jgi:hypothetical protein